MLHRLRGVGQPVVELRTEDGVPEMGVGSSVRFLARRLMAFRHGAAGAESGEKTAEYWTRHNVTLHRRFTTPEESFAYLQWRNDQYFPYIDLMPVHGQDGRVVLDFGCGPGHDLIGFGTSSQPSRLIGADVSATSLQEARARLAMHSIEAELVQLEPGGTALPLEAASVDHVHTSGVLHHTANPVALLGELRRVLRPGGTMNIMVYNYESLWLHLYVAYQKCVVEGRFEGLDIRAAFARTTDGEDCPIANVYRPQEFVALGARAGLDLEFVGAAISMHEASLFAQRYAAVGNMRLRPESRRFLLDLEIDRHGLPTYQGQYAGVDGCYRLRAAR